MTTRLAMLAARLAVATAFIAVAACGQVTVETDDAGTDVAVDTGDGGGGGGTDAGGDGGGVDAQPECITNFDCNELKGKTPCNFPVCDAGTCKLQNRDPGTACKDAALVAGTCQDSVCDPVGTCVLAPKKQGTACDPNAAVGACEAAACDDTGGCVVAAKADGAHCGLGVCGNKCFEGSCVNATAADYEDGNPCTKDYCDQGAKVAHDAITDLTLLCDDGDPCTKADFCLEGKCSGTLDTCNDAQPCTVDTCDKAKGCLHTPDDKTCTGSDPCVVLGCDLGEGCTATAVKADAACDDGDSCTKGDACDAKGSCQGKTNACTCAADADCDQTNLCLPRVCDLASKVCVVDEAKAPSCDTSKDGPCAATTCDPATGQCATMAIAGAGSCDDNDACTSKSACKDVACVGAIDVVCDDGNPCTTDSCDPLAGCQAVPGSDSCDDGNPCTESDACLNGACTGSPKACDDGVACTFDACDTTSGKCQNTAADSDCNDNNPCTTDSCDATVAKGCANKPDDVATCTDDDECTLTACKSGQCIVTATDKQKPGCGCGKDAECDDKNACTADSCVAGDCKFDPGPNANKACDTGNVCHVAASGTCSGGACTGGKAKDCSASAGPCVDAACNPATGACGTSTKADGSKCDADGSLCTVDDVCKAGACKAGAPLSCSGQGDACNLAACDAKTGKCVTSPAAKGSPCDDGDVCSDADSCDAGKCIAGKAKDCTAFADACNTATCDKAAQQCVKKPKTGGTTCDDGQYCTTGEACDGKGACIGGKDKECANGGNACLVGVCDEAKNSCTTKPVAKGTTCIDGDACTLTDACDGAGKCAGSNPKSCTGDACNDGTCDAKTGTCGKKPKAKGVACNDGDLCTQTDTCDGAGVCAGANPKVCSGDACNDPTCNTTTGACGKKAKANGTKCEDGSDCTAGDTCSAGSCKGGTYTCACKVDVDCDDKNACTKDNCVTVGTALTCKNNPLTGTACSDDNLCTSSDVCDSSGKCAGKAVACDDGNACTIDACVASTGKCGTTPQTKGYPCDDKNLCSTNDICDGAAACAGGAVKCDDGNACTDDACDATTGKCVATPNKVACEDGNLCTLKDACDGAGKCASGAPVVCDDGTKCTTDGCDSKTGSCTTSPTGEGATCEVGSYSACAAGKCGCRVGIRTSGGTSSDRLYGVVHAADQGTLAVGTTYQSPYGYRGYVTRRDKIGGALWMAAFDHASADANTDILWGVRLIQPGVYVAVGYRGVASGNEDGWMVIIDDAGKVLKSALITGGAKSDVLRSVAVVDAKTAFAAGYSASFNADGNGIAYTSGWLVRLDPTSAAVVWQKPQIGKVLTSKFPIAYAYYHYYFYGVTANASAVYTVGTTNAPGAGSNDGVVSKWDLSGNLVATKLYGTTGADAFQAVHVYSTSSLFVAGSVTNGANGLDGWMVRLNPADLALYNDYRYGTTGSDEFAGLTGYSNAVFAVGRQYDGAVGKYRPWLFRSTSSGAQSGSYLLDTNAQTRSLSDVSYDTSTGYVAAVGETYTGANYDAYEVGTTVSGTMICK